MKLLYPAICKSGSITVPYFITNHLYESEEQAKRDLGATFICLARGAPPYNLDELKKQQAIANKALQPSLI